VLVVVPRSLLYPSRSLLLVASGIVVWIASLFFWPLPVANPLSALGFAFAGSLFMARCGLLCGMASR
jgi:ABC-2 type transport system permease protein